MTRESSLSGTVVQAENPSWLSLEAATETEPVRCFMWMFEIRLEDGTRVDAYKHVSTRAYLHLADGGRAYRYGVDGRYRRVDLVGALAVALDASSDLVLGRP